MLFGFSSPALAHSSLVSSIPGADSVVMEFPEEITLTFNEELISIGIGLGNVIKLEGPDGSDIPLDKPLIEKSKISTPVLQPGKDPGRYLISYRVVSSDGHPIEGAITFIYQSESVIAPAPSAQAAQENVDKLLENGETGKALIIFALLAGVALVAYLRFIGKK